jgi:hypothetical protein
MGWVGWVWVCGLGQPVYARHSCRLPTEVSDHLYYLALSSRLFLNKSTLVHPGFHAVHTRRTMYNDFNVLPHIKTSAQARFVSLKVRILSAIAASAPMYIYCLPWTYTTKCR